MWVGPLPEFERLYAVPQAKPSFDTATDEEWRAVPLLTPRQAVAMWFTADELAGEWSAEDVDDLIEMLPPAIQPIATEVFVRRLARCFSDVADRIAVGAVGEMELARCTGDEWAVHRILEAAQDWLATLHDTMSTDNLAEDFARETSATWLDEVDGDDFASNIVERVLQDSDVEWVYEAVPDAFERAHPELDQFGLANLHPSQWFLPFNNVEDLDAS